AREGPFEAAQTPAVEAGVDDGTGASAGVASIRRGGRGLRGEDTGEVVGQRHADAHRRPVGVAGEVHEAAEPDTHPIESGSFGQRTVLSEGRDAYEHDPVVEVGGRDVPTLEGAGPEVLDDDIGSGGKAAQDVLAVGLAEIERDAL